MTKWRPVSFANIAIDDSFWSPRLQANREHTLPAEYRQCKDTGRIDAFALDWKPGKEPKPHFFWDSDVAKWVEAASCSLAQFPDPELERLLEEVVALIVSAQQPDGYLNIYFTAVEPENRWKNLIFNHELYCAGHLIEAAVTHYEATGRRTLLDAMCRYADYIGTVFGRGEGQLRGYCGHEEIELALVRLYRTTGEERYLRLAQYFVDERGQSPHYMVREMTERGTLEPPFDPEFAYCQAHKPVREQTEVVGHAVRAMYLYCAMADLAGELGDASLLAACERIWSHLCEKNIYLTGGIGSSRHNEGFTGDYDLPNDTAYAETCASVGFVMWNHRLLLNDCDGRYADMLERALYNGVISGVSLDGTRFFYENPLASSGSHHRKDWFGCACCPPNVARLLASLGGYVYSASDGDAAGAGDAGDTERVAGAEGGSARPADEEADVAYAAGRSMPAIAVHLYMQSRARLSAGGQAVTIEQETLYPWDGRVRLTLAPERAAEFELRLRIPGWCRQASLRINGVRAALPASGERTESAHAAASSEAAASRVAAAASGSAASRGDAASNEASVSGEAVSASGPAASHGDAASNEASASGEAASASEASAANEPAEPQAGLRSGYAVIRREWQPGDVVELDLAMPVERVYSHPQVRANAGRVALQRGPIVYALEQADNGARLDDLALPAGAALEAAYEPGLLGGVVAIRGEALRSSAADWEGGLYGNARPASEPAAFTAVPYACWDNREGGEMLVWLREGI